MTSFIPRTFLQSQIAQFIALVLGIILFTAPLYSQQPTSPPAKPAAARETPKAEPTFYTLLAADSYERPSHPWKSLLGAGYQLMAEISAQAL